MTKLEKFINKANIKHNDKYDYNLVNYINNKTKIKITCKVHGEFAQRPCDHLIGQGCPHCAGNVHKTTEQFISDVNMVHNNLYKYTSTNYINNAIKVIITCNTHGDFLQEPHSHLKGQGCPHCANINRHEYYNNTPTQFYIIKYKGFYKVGITTRDVTTRYSYEVTDCSEIETLFVKYFNNYKDAYEYEQLIIKLNQKYKYSGEPIFRNTGNTEVFTDLWKESFN